VPSIARGDRSPVLGGLVAGALGVALAAVLAGCAEPRWEYDKRGVTAVKLERDLRECRREAFDPRRLTFLGPRVDPSKLNRCMEGRGYTVRPAE
jgi:hypothetical protein